eukprot:SAG31_NODE_26619_length_439_cov_0.947059_1_plen_106_part_01
MGGRCARAELSFAPHVDDALQPLLEMPPSRQHAKTGAVMRRSPSRLQPISRAAAAGARSAQQPPANEPEPTGRRFDDRLFSLAGDSGSAEGRVEKEGLGLCSSGRI